MNKTTIKTIYGLGKELKLKDPYGKDYPKILVHVLKELGESRPFKNWREGEINAKRNRLEKTCKEHIKRWEGEQEMIEVDFKTVRIGQSVEQTRRESKPYEILLSAVHIAQILQTDRTILEKYGDTFIDCAADEYFWDGGGWVDSLYFSWDGGRLHFNGGYADGALPGYAAGVAFLSGVDRDSSLGHSESVAPSTFEGGESTQNEITLNGEVYVKKSETTSPSMSTLKEIHSELMSLSNKIKGFIKEQKGKG